MLTRRGFLKLGMLSGLKIGLPMSAFCGSELVDRHKELLMLTEDLLSEWCEGLLLYQVSKPWDATRDGGLWSPGDRRIMGRSGDAVYPLLWAAQQYQDERFLIAAEKVMKWSLINVAQPDGSWKNDVQDKWNGITVFITTAMAQAILHHGDILKKNIRESWLERLRLSGQWLYDTIDVNFSNINYPAANAHAMALLGIQLNDPRFISRGQELAHSLLAWFTKHDGLFFGEGRKNKLFPFNRSPKGCYPVDLGYNVEESLPALTLYGLLQQDDEILEKVTESLRVHLEFMLPDGGWDNSWGTRNYKWTWWGSRTSDGCQPAYALLADRDPVFLEAAYRNTRLLKECTYKGVLFGGPDYVQHGVRASLHHTFCHAKALATVLNGKVPQPSQQTIELPCQQAYGIRVFQDIATWLVSHGPWRATVTGYDYPSENWLAGHATGGSLSLLWHRDVGLLLSASMSVYHLIDPGDMQNDWDLTFRVLTPRLELEIGQKQPFYSKALDLFQEKESAKLDYMNILDSTAKINSAIESEAITITTRSKLVDLGLRSPETGDVECTVIYRFTGETLEINVTTEHSPTKGELRYILPIVSRTTEPVTLESTKCVSIKKGGYRVLVTSDHDLILPESTQSRIFNYVPGLQALSVMVRLEQKLNVRIEVLETA